MNIPRKIQVQLGSVKQLLESLQRSKMCSVVFFFVPGHVGVQSKERTDLFAGLATIDETNRWTVLTV